MKHGKNSEARFDCYWRFGSSMLYAIGFLQLGFAFMTTSSPFLSPILSFGGMSSAFAAGLIASLYKRIELLENRLEAIQTPK